jgi:hypothetical protein
MSIHRDNDHGEERDSVAQLDLGGLIAQSYKHDTPVFALLDEQIEQAGFILETMKKSRDGFRESFDSIAHSIEIIIGLSKPA